MKKRVDKVIAPHKEAKTKSKTDTEYLRFVLNLRRHGSYVCLTLINCSLQIEI